MGSSFMAQEANGPGCHGHEWQGKGSPVKHLYAAKQAAALPAALGSTVTWASARASERMTSAWKEEWETARRPTAWWAPVTSAPPSTRPKDLVRDFPGDRSVQSRAFQASIGHAFCGEYYARFVPVESPLCSCAVFGRSAVEETLRHALLECPRHRHARDLAFMALRSERLTPDLLLGTPDGRKAFVEFLKLSKAFSKVSRPVV
jgi:hypothetical protein